jgi:tetratricopeptide (TPR) repeat protein
MKAWISVVAMAVAVTLTSVEAAAQTSPPQAALRIDGREAHVGIPFVLSMVIEGFAEDPAPQVPELKAEGLRAKALSADPSVSQSIRIINGRRSDSRTVTWVLRWQLEADRAGTFTIPSITASQGTSKVTTKPARVRVEDVATTSDMKIALSLPDRPVWVGETITAEIVWLLRRDPADQVFSIPLLTLDDAVVVTPPPVKDPRQALAFSTGGRDLQLPFVRDEVTADGKQFTRLRFQLLLAPKQPGTIDIPASTVAANLEVGGRRDFFGNASTRLFRASDVARTLVVKPLPLADRPASFAGAVGTSFSMAVHAGRSVVQLGEPVELEVTVRSDQRLDNLSLGKLDGEGGFPRAQFTVPSDPPTGELSEDGTSKTFRFQVQVVGPASEIPALALSYFDPVKAQYQTIHSEPIALSVKGGTLVGASDVVARPSTRSGGAPPTTAATSTELPAEGLLELSASAASLARPLGGPWIWPLVGLLYLGPLSLLLLRLWRQRTAGTRGEAHELKAARRQLDDALAQAARQPARDSAGAVAAALRHLLRAAPVTSDAQAVIVAVEDAGYAPTTSGAPLSSELIDKARRIAAAALKRRRKLPSATVSGSGIALLVLGFAAPSTAYADAFSDGRSAYTQAMGTQEASEKRRLFTLAASHFAQAVEDHPDRPELLTDWGNACLGAGNLGLATLAFRRALAIDPSNPRAQRNLAWLRSRLPEGFALPVTSAADTLFFFHRWPRMQRIVVGAVAFALAMLLLAPWALRRARGYLIAALLPAAGWLAMTASLVLENRRSDDAVILDSAVLRAADSAGAPPALAQPLPPGAEVIVLETRDDWQRITTPAGSIGWVPARYAERVVSR